MIQSPFTSLELSRTLRLERALQGVEELTKNALTIEADFVEDLAVISPEFQASVHNLAHYLGIRQHDIRPLQQELHQLGLSSLGTLESHVMASLNAVLRTLYQLSDRPLSDHLKTEPLVTFETGKALLQQHTHAILGHNESDRTVQIMVTMPREAADHPQLIYDLLADGMNIMRINCAHDDALAWQGMIEHLRQAQQQLNKPCKISFDLAGPKLRTGQIEPGPQVIRWHPKRNELGQVIAPALIQFICRFPEEKLSGVLLPVGNYLVAQAQVGDILYLQADARGRKRSVLVTAVHEGYVTGECDRTAYVTTGMPLKLYRDSHLICEDNIVNLPSVVQSISLTPGDILQVVQGDALGKAAERNSDAQVVVPSTVSCTLPEIFRDVKSGERIFFDDGIIEGIIQEVQDSSFQVKIVAVAGGSAKLKGEKGINLPDTDLHLPALTEKDLQDLEFIAQYGDMVALSFVQCPEDILQLISQINRHRAHQLGIILKIETQRAFSHLPSLLMTAMQHPYIAVMIARGDLGVEVGFERMSEVQEEILWLCEAAHVPVIWATQVLESLAKGGLPSRAEVTDAAMGIRAECVMLNKGPYINQTLKFLCGILTRMQTHQEKRMATLRKLHVSFLEE